MDPAGKTEETICPEVRAILGDVIIQDDGVAFVDNYVNWIIALRKLPAKEHSQVFLQLAIFARQYFDAGCKPVGTSLASLARIGLDRLAKREMQNAPH